MMNYAQKGNNGYPLVVNTYGGKFASSDVPSMAVQVVPVDKSFGYESLTHGNQLNGRNYFSITTAYPSNCSQFVKRNCDGNLSDQPLQAKPVGDTILNTNYNLASAIPMNIPDSRKAPFLVRQNF